MKLGGLLQPLPVPARPWRQVCLDFTAGLPTTPSSHNAILVFSDELTRMVWLAATRDTCTAKDAATLIIQHVYRSHGLPQSLVSDRILALLHVSGEQLIRLLVYSYVSPPLTILRQMAH